MRNHSLKSIIALLVTLVAVPVFGQENSSGGLVAVLDVAKVFKNNAEFDQKLKAIKTEADAFKVQIEERQQQIREQAQQVMELEVGSANRNAAEAQIEQDQTALRTQARQIEGDLLKREARIYYDAYTEMQTIVGRLAQQYGITLVLRFDSSEINPDNRGDVVKGVNRAVVYHSRLDLTSAVIKEMSSASAGIPTNNK